MKLSYLIIGVILFFMGVFLKTKLVIAVGIIFVILSLSERKEAEKKEKVEHKILTSKSKCSNCGAEVLSDDNFCPECGKKVLP